MTLELDYDECVDNFFTGDYHLIPPRFRDIMIEKYGDQQAKLVDKPVEVEIEIDTQPVVEVDQEFFKS